MSSNNGELHQRQAAFHIGDWLVEPSLNRVSRGDVSHHLAFKVMEALVFLAENAGVMVPKQRIIDAVWRKEFITENTLTQAITDLRRVFDDDARNPRFIETITKRGYRLIGPVEFLCTPQATDSARLPCGVVIGGNEILLAVGENLIGRTREAVVRIDSDEVSRRHARVIVSSHEATLEDLGSKNGTYLWGERIETPVPLADGDEITIGTVELTFRRLESSTTTKTARAVKRPRRS